MANKPKMEFLLNVPAIVTLGNNFKNGTGEYGPWFGWGVIEQGIEKTLFADSDLQAKIAPFGKGAQLSITKSQIPGTRQFGWSVVPANQPTTQPPAFIPPPVPYGATSSYEITNSRDDYRAERVARAREAIIDAEGVLDAASWSREDVRALAISFLIDEQRQGIAPPETAGF